MIRIVILTCVWKRYEITRLFLEQFKVLKNYKPKEFKLELVVVGSESKSLDLVKNYTKHYIHHENLPLGKKWNAGLKYCKNLDFDYILLLGSDDIMSVSTLDVYQLHIKFNKLYVGLLDFYVYDTITKRMNYWSGYKNKRIGEPIGAGRLISIKVLKQLDFKLWEDGKNNGLDGSMTKILLSQGIEPTTILCKKKKIMLVDLKSAVNIGKFNRYDGDSVTARRLLPYYFKEIYKQITQL